MLWNNSLALALGAVPNFNSVCVCGSHSIGNFNYWCHGINNFVCSQCKIAMQTTKNNGAVDPKQNSALENVKQKVLCEFKQAHNPAMFEESIRPALYEQWTLRLEANFKRNKR